eukprot:7245337-Pyramimonas_sp.AAC.1
MAVLWLAGIKSLFGACGGLSHFAFEADSEMGGAIAVKRKPPAGKSVSVSCLCRACRRGEAA